MNRNAENRYLNLIQLILSSPRKQEIDILNAHREFIDSDFISYLMSSGEELRKKGELQPAERLIDLADKLLKIQTSNVSTYKREEYFRFLLAVLQKVSEGIQPQLIYNFLRKNQDKIDSNLINLLEYWATETLLSVGAQQQQAIANDLVNFANLISEFNSGNKIKNLELAIVAYQAALKIYEPTTFPKNWAIINTNLANAWRDRGISGATERDKSIETAIGLYELALEVITQEKYAYAWGNLQRNLGIAYLYRQTENYGENLEVAIACYKKALSVHNFDDFPQEWAASNNNLGDVFLKRLWGDKENNIEMAISYLEAALRVYTLQNFPHNWAMIQNNLGNAFQSRIKGDKSDNIERAIFYYQNALSIHTLEDYPYNWAMLNNNLAGAYRYRLQGDKNKNKQQAIAFLKRSLIVFTQDKFPQQWADIQQNISNLVNK
ncbi:MAG: hypothetical protein Tsb0014_02630 [Pleurocapsa sp.]